MRLNSFDVLDADAETYFYGFKFQNALLVFSKTVICFNLRKEET